MRSEDDCACRSLFLDTNCRPVQTFVVLRHKDPEPRHQDKITTSPATDMAGGGGEVMYDTAAQLVAMNRLATETRQAGDLFHGCIVRGGHGGKLEAAGGYRWCSPCYMRIGLAGTSTWERWRAGGAADRPAAAEQRACLAPQPSQRRKEVAAKKRKKQGRGGQEGHEQPQGQAGG
ncbi:hypothetical protein HXX76_009477 [Chlamydomonas incerta]|uniref:Uncharacterized protein n=1 Tax=Chlamydomonas incerta TaxID=51695 RepID=A0A835SU02_CHLIN|nr:hypothetical protein HXX76_009477 [Chlamydomonas incerta]|eukprot:KAG2431462.1 hypothetical protein HXX76_009477 [Chlamydomonas incerta]